MDTYYFLFLLVMKRYYKKGSEKRAEKSKLDYEELFLTGVSELRFQLLVRDSLLNTMDEAISFTNDPLVKKVLLLAKEREALDRLIHTRTIFEDKPQGFSVY